MHGSEWCDHKTEWQKEKKRSKVCSAQIKSLAARSFSVSGSHMRRFGKYIGVTGRSKDLGARAEYQMC